MNDTSKRDPAAKAILRRAYRASLLIHNLLTARRRVAAEPRVFYGGARAGDRGGPLVKVQRMMTRFPQHLIGYNVVYQLSNAAYLPASALRRLGTAGVKLVHNQNGVFYPSWFEGDWRAMNVQMAHGYHAADHVFWQSEFCRRSADRYLGPRLGSGEVLYNAVDTTYFAPAAERPHRPFTFLLTGKIARHLFYRIESTIVGLAQARRQGFGARLVIAGALDPWCEEAAKALCTQHDLDEAVTLLGPYRQADAPAIYGDADAYVMTKHNDPCPNTVLEALACGLPVLYAASGGVPELVGDDAGVGLPVPEDWERPHAPSRDAIAEGMITIAGSRSRMAEAARRRAVERFDLRAWLDRHDEVFRSLISGSKL
jgi:glycosyltransferase involved in cell wall biosynthesis